MDPRRAIPSVERLLASPAFAALEAAATRARVHDTLDGVLTALRAALASGAAPPPRIAEPEWYAEQVSARIEESDRSSLRRVINATGVVLHTNLGRAPLAGVAVGAIARAAARYSNLEYDLEQGERGTRYVHCVALLRELTGAEDALVVNNNAAALVLALNTLAADREAVISRGELVEIGGSFRIPEIMARSGARMREVGSTNRTHASDYADAIGPATGTVLKVHRSNFAVVGFTTEVDVRALRDVAGDVPIVHDLGSGLLLDAATLGLPAEPTPARALADGADVVTFSGDKLLGGPQAGIVVGRAAVIARMRANPLCRALRVDKLTLAGLEATLALYRDPARALRQIPVLRMLTASAEEIGERAQAFAERLRAQGCEADTRAGESRIGGGAYPAAARGTVLVAIVPPAGRSAAALERRLRAGHPPVVARVAEDRVLLDLRTVFPDEEDALARAVADALG